MTLCGCVQCKLLLVEINFTSTVMRFHVNYCEHAQIAPIIVGLECVGVQGTRPNWSCTYMDMCT